MYRERFDPSLPEFGPETASAKYFKLRHEMALPYVNGKHVLDIPCGLGVGSAFLAREAYTVLGVDRDEESVLKARTNTLGIPGLLFASGDMIAIPLPDSCFDVVTCFEGYEHLTQEDQPRFLAEAHHVLVPGGLLIMTCPVDVKSENPFHLHEPTTAELVEEVSKLFTIERNEPIREHGSQFIVAKK